jgi:hypothetical protein
MAGLPEGRADIQGDGLALAGAGPGEVGRTAKLGKIVGDSGCTRQKGRAR